MRLSLVACLVFATACGMSATEGGDQAAGDDDGGSGSGGGAPGNGVSFGGAQDIGEFRAALDRGELPHPDMFDANGFFNEHYNEPPQIACGGKLCLTPGLSVGKDWRTGAYQAALQVSIATYVDPSTYTRLPMKLVVVVDHSGSMSSDLRLEKVKAGLHTLIDNLRDEDRLAIVSFDDVVTYDAPFGTETATLDRAHLHDVVTRLEPRGGTNIYDGLEAGLAMLGETPSNERQNRVIFLSDGLATVGNTSQQAIVEMATGYIERGIGLTTIGVGNDFDVLLMRGLAEFGAGNFYYVEDATAANEVFTEELDYFMSPLALDIAIDATAADGWEFARVRGARQWTATTRTGAMAIPAVFLASRVDQQPSPDGGRRGGGSMIFIDMVPSTNRAGTVATLSLSYRLPGQSERITHEITLDYDRDPQQQLEEPYLSYPGMAERYAMFNMFLGLDRATKYAAYSPGCALATLDATQRYGSGWAEAHPADLDMAADLGLVDQFRQLLALQGTEPVGLATCADVDGPQPIDGDPVGDDWDGHEAHYGCSSSRGSAGWLVLVVGALFLRRRRR